MPYKNKKDLYEAQKRYRKRKKAEFKAMEKELEQLRKQVKNLETENQS